MSQSQPPKLSKKQLKANAFRSKKKIKDILQEPLAVPEDDDGDHHDDELISGISRVSKKRKQPPTADSTTLDPDQVDPDAEEFVHGAAAKRRKRKKAAMVKSLEEDRASKSSKLILFIGNLPFDITIDRLKSFFLEHCEEEPVVRLMTPKAVDSSSSNLAPTKGCGFIEFKSSAALQKALRLHHTPLSSDPDPSKENQKKARKINIELTAGGGGNSESRQKKLDLSKARLSKQREKRIEKTIKEATEKKLKYGLEDPEGNVSIKLGTKKKAQPTDEEGKANWGAKARGHSGQSAVLRTKEKWRPQTSGANAIRLG